MAFASGVGLTFLNALGIYHSHHHHIDDFLHRAAHLQNMHRLVHAIDNRANYIELTQLLQEFVRNVSGSEIVKNHIVCSSAFEFFNREIFF